MLSYRHTKKQGASKGEGRVRPETQTKTDRKLAIFNMSCVEWDYVVDGDKKEEKKTTDKLSRTALKWHKALSFAVTVQGVYNRRKKACGGAQVIESRKRKSRKENYP